MPCRCGSTSRLLVPVLLPPGFFLFVTTTPPADVSCVAAKECTNMRDELLGAGIEIHVLSSARCRNGRTGLSSVVRRGLVSQSLTEASIHENVNSSCPAIECRGSRARPTRALDTRATTATIPQRDHPSFHQDIIPANRPIDLCSTAALNARWGQETADGVGPGSSAQDL